MEKGELMGSIVDVAGADDPPGIVHEPR